LVLKEAEKQDGHSHEGLDQEMNLSRKDRARSKDFKKSKKRSTTNKILNRASNRKGDPVSGSQRDFENKVNSKEMQSYTIGVLKEVMKGNRKSGALNGDQIVARRNLERLAKTLRRQGKSKKEAYNLISRQMKKQFSGNVVLKGNNPGKPWSIKPNGNLEVYSLANNRDQVISYTAQALTLKHDPIYNAKRKQWLNANKKLKSLKKSATFENDFSEIKNLESKINSLSKELEQRQVEIFS